MDTTKNNHVANSNEDAVNDNNTNNDLEEVQCNLPSLANYSTTRPPFFLLYLNKYRFEGDGGQDQNELTPNMQSCIDDPTITIMLIHEKDLFRGIMYVLDSTHMMVSLGDALNKMQWGHSRKLPWKSFKDYFYLRFMILFLIASRWLIECKCTLNKQFNIDEFL